MNSDCIINIFMKTIWLVSKEPCAFVWSLFVVVLHLCDAGAKLHGSFGQDCWLAEAHPLRRQPQEEFLPDAPRERQVGLLPHGQSVQVAHHVLVQVGKPVDRYNASEWNTFKLKPFTLRGEIPCSYLSFRVLVLFMLVHFSTVTIYRDT